MATEINPKRVSPLTGETLTNERVYWEHVDKARLLDTSEPLLVEEEANDSDFYDSLTANEVLEAIESGVFTAEEALEYELQVKQRKSLITKLEALNAKFSKE